MTHILAIGDSLTYGYPDGSSWTRALESLPGVVVRNAGLNGDTLWGIESRLETRLASETPDMCLVMGGTNDVYQGEPLAKMKATTMRIDERLRRARVRPVWGLPPPVLFGELEKLLRPYRDWLGTWAEQTLPFYDLFSTPNGYRAELLPDGCHPSPEGYRLMGEMALRLLREYGKAAPKKPSG